MFILLAIAAMAMLLWRKHRRLRPALPAVPLAAGFGMAIAAGLAALGLALRPAKAWP